MDIFGIQYLVCALFGIISLITYFVRRSIKHNFLFLFMILLVIFYSLLEYELYFYTKKIINLDRQLLYFTLKTFTELIMVVHISTYLSYKSSITKRTVKEKRLVIGCIFLFDLVMQIIFVVLALSKVINSGMILYNSFHFLHILSLFALSLSALVFSISSKNRRSKYLRNLILFLSILLMFSYLSLLKLSSLEFAFTYIVFIVVCYVNIENVGKYTNSIYDVFNEKAFLELVNRKYQLDNTTLVVVKVKKVEFIKDKFDETTTNSILHAILKREQKYFKFKNVFYLENEYYLIKTRNYCEEDFISHVKEFFSNVPILSMYSLSVYPCFSKLTLGDNKTINKKMISEWLLVFYSNVEKLKPYEMLKTTKKLNDAVKREALIVKAIRKAIVNNSFEVYYQPIYNNKDSKNSGSEALVRLSDKNMGFISPEEFIPIAEKHGLINDIDRLVIRHAVNFIKEYSDILDINYIDLNLSHNEISNKSFVDELIKIIKTSKVDTKKIHLEITETSKHGNDDKIISNMKRLKDLGFKFSLDDYGSGYASLDYLTKFDFDIIKIDKSILWGLSKSCNNYILFLNIVKLARDLNKEIVVEGVESIEHVKILDQLNVSLMQGYYFSEPLNKNMYIKYLKEGKNND